MIKKISILRKNILRFWHKLTFNKVDSYYLKWLGFANAGMMNAGNIYQLDYAIKNLPENGAIVEIGSFSGLSTNIINWMKVKYNKKNILFTCDKWDFEGSNIEYLQESNILFSDYKIFIKESFIRNISFFSKNMTTHTIEAYSDEFFNYWASSSSKFDVFGNKINLGGEIAFCFIDGDHSYKQSLKDFKNVDKFLTIGGFILFDDSADFSNFGSRRTAKEVISKPNYKLISKNPNYLVQKIC